MTNALIFAGGHGSRMNSRSKPKQFLQLYGKEIIVHTVENFQNHPLIDGIVIVCKEDWIDFAKNLVQKYALTKVSSIIPGGETGQESIFYGLRALSEHCDEKSIVLVHDGVRPFVSFELISSCVDSVRRFGSAVTAVPATESIVTADTHGTSCTTDRLAKAARASAGDITASPQPALACTQRLARGCRL